MGASKNRLRGSIPAAGAQLASQGFVVAGDPQFRVGYHVSTLWKVDIRTVSSRYGYDHSMGGGDIQIRGETRTQVDEYERGTLVIDVVDTARGALVWRSVGERRLLREPTPEQTNRTIRETVAQILGSFPPNGG